MVPESSQARGRHDNAASPIVTILLPAHNAESTLNQALDSLVHQTLADWECLIINDGSADDTASIANTWAERDARFKVINTPDHSGIVSALNLGLTEAKGRFIARQDADDISRPERLAKTIHLIESNHHLAAVGCQVAMFPSDQIPSGFTAYGQWLNSLNTPDEIARDIWIESPLPHPTVVIRPQALFSCHGYRATSWPEDYDLWLQMHCAGWQFAKVPEILYDWRHHRDRLTICNERYSTEAFLDCKLHHLAPLLLCREICIWGAGRDGRRLGRALMAKDHRVAAFIDIDPGKIGRTRQGAPVLSPEELPTRYPRQEPADSSGQIPLILVAVGTKGARDLIRRHLTQIGWQEPTDYICLH